MSNFGATIFGLSGPVLTDAERAFFREANPFGFILFDRNLENASQIKALCDDLRACVEREAPITIDQEGGRVQRLRAPLARDWLPPLDHVTRAGADAEKAMYFRYRLIAEDLRALGIDSNCAPMVDVAEADTHPFLKNRCYGMQAEEVARMGRAVAQGLLDGGVLPVVKHIPGHGRARADSHLELPVVTAEAEDLSDTDFAPFAALNDLPMGMTAHLKYTALDGRPATLSPVIMNMIRTEIGFQGLIMTDDISMKALTGDLGDLSRQALTAGCDVILHCNGDLAEMQVVADAAGQCTALAQSRAEAALAARKPPLPIDIAVMEAQLEALLDGRGDG